jgi:TRAP-type mannitol/chloroaromatic compound transport system permease small subunit
MENPSALENLTGVGAPDHEPPASPFGRVVGGLNALGTVWIMILMVLINADIIGRAVLSKPIAGVPEIAAYSIVGIVFLQLAHTLQIGSLTRTDVLLGVLMRSRPRLYHALVGLFDLVGAAIFAIVAWRMIPAFLDAFNDTAHNFIGNPGFFTAPKWPLFLIVLIDVVFTAAQFLVGAIASFGAMSKTPTREGV